MKLLYIYSFCIALLLFAPIAIFAGGETESSEDIPGKSHSGSIEEVHFLIPGGAGGGWDSTARGVGDVLMKAKLIKQVSYANMSGGGGGVAIANLIQTRNSNLAKKTLMVNSTPIITRSLSKVFPQSFRDLIPVAAIIADYGAFVVRMDSPLQTWQDAVVKFLADPASVKVAGGSALGSLDHIVAAWAFKEAGGDPNKVVYIPYDAGGKAMAGLLAGETELLSTGLGEALQLLDTGQVRILSSTAPTRIPDAPDVITLKEQGFNVDFANWRGFFAAPGTSAETVAAYNAILSAMYNTPEWEETRSRNGWANQYKPGAEFVDFLEEQERVIGNLMRELGFIE